MVHVRLSNLAQQNVLSASSNRMEEEVGGGGGALARQVCCVTHTVAEECFWLYYFCEGVWESICHKTYNSVFQGYRLHSASG